VLGEVLGLAPGTSLVARAGAEIRRQALIRSLRLVLGVLAERAPTVLVLEDLHWIDRASQDVLTEIVTDVPGRRILVLVAQPASCTRGIGAASPKCVKSAAERLGGQPFLERSAFFTSLQRFPDRAL
jgi:adenylate cyclase